MIDHHFGKCYTKTCTFRTFQKHFKTFRFSWISYLSFFFIGIVKKSQHLRWRSSSNRKRMTLKNNLSCANIVVFPIWVSFSVCFQVALERLHMEPYIWLYKFVWSVKNQMGEGALIELSPYERDRQKVHTKRNECNLIFSPQCHCLHIPVNKGSRTVCVCVYKNHK